MSARKLMLPLGILAGILLPVASLAQEAEPAKTYPVTGVVDGITLTLAERGKVRLLGVELHRDRLYALQAAGFTRRLVGGKSVRLEMDEPAADKDGTPLAYVYLPDNTLVNQEIIRQGWGFVSGRYSFKYLFVFRQYQRDAQDMRRGLWAHHRTLPKHPGPTQLVTPHLLLDQEKLERLISSIPGAPPVRPKGTGPAPRAPRPAKPDTAQATRAFLQAMQGCVKEIAGADALAKQSHATLEGLQAKGYRTGPAVERANGMVRLSLDRKAAALQRAIELCASPGVDQLTRGRASGIALDVSEGRMPATTALKALAAMEGQFR